MFLFLMCVPMKTIQDVISPETGVSDSCETCGCWELNPGPLEEQPVLVRVEPFQPPQEVKFCDVLLFCDRLETSKPLIH